MPKKKRRVEKLDIGLLLLGAISLYVLLQLGVTVKDIVEMFFKTLFFLAIGSLVAKKVVEAFKEIKIGR